MIGFPTWKEGGCFPERTASISRCRSSCRYTLSCASPLIVCGLIVALETVPMLQSFQALRRGEWEEKEKDNSSGTRISQKHKNFFRPVSHRIASFPQKFSRGKFSGEIGILVPSTTPGYLSKFPPFWRFCLPPLHIFPSWTGRTGAFVWLLP